MPIKKMRINQKTENGYDVLYPETSADQVITSNGQTVAEHLEESMPHKFLDNGKWYRWGFRTVNGEPQMIYKEVV